ncbi:MAG: ABC transporter ATP-binding protein [Clostridiales bacterium]|nr:ABC transporter ATP-binding protein [Clostridiales bacterium]
MDAFIDAKGIKRRFHTSGGDFWALKGVDIVVPRGKLTILKGRSGSGKTTLMNILGALDKPTAGEVWFDGKNIVGMSERSQAKLRRKEIGFVFQSVALIPMMTAQENVEYALRMARSKESWEKRAEECLKMVNLGTRMKHMPQELSGGEQQRVCIARALAHRPKVIFADEPTAELDTLTGLQVVKIFKTLCEQEGVTVVMTTHDTGLMEIGDAVYELEDGERVYGRA